MARNYRVIEKDGDPRKHNVVRITFIWLALITVVAVSGCDSDIASERETEKYYRDNPAQDFCRYQTYYNDTGTFSSIVIAPWCFLDKGVSFQGFIKERSYGGFNVYLTQQHAEHDDWRNSIPITDPDANNFLLENEHCVDIWVEVIGVYGLPEGGGQYGILDAHSIEDPNKVYSPTSDNNPKRCWSTIRPPVTNQNPS